MNKEEIKKMFHRIEIDKSNDSCGFEFADGFGCTFDNIATCYDDRLKLYDLVKELQQENKELHNKIDKAIELLSHFSGCQICEHTQELAIKVEEILKGDADEL